MCLVVDWTDRVQVMDPNGEELSTTQALDYLELRMDGVAPKQALRSVGGS